MKPVFLKYSAWLCVSLFLLACGSESTDTVETDEVTDTIDEVVEVEVMEDEMDYVLPSPLRIASILNRAGLTYENGLTNSYESIENYATSVSKMLNFGVYSADMSYCVLNEETQEALNYMKSVKQLSDDLGLSSIFNSESLITSFENNLTDKDTLIDILITVQEELDIYTEENEEQFMKVVIFSGAWVESMYLGSKVASEENTQLAGRLVEQMTILDNMISGLSKNPNQDAVIEQLVVDLQAVKSIYEGFGSMQGMTEDDEPDFENMTISEEEKTALTSKIEAIRTGIING